MAHESEIQLRKKRYKNGGKNLVIYCIKLYIYSTRSMKIQRLFESEVIKKKILWNKNSIFFRPLKQNHDLHHSEFEDRTVVLSKCGVSAIIYAAPKRFYSQICSTCIWIKSQIKNSVKTKNVVYRVISDNQERLSL